MPVKGFWKYSTLILEAADAARNNVSIEWYRLNRKLCFMHTKILLELVHLIHTLCKCADFVAEKQLASACARRIDTGTTLQRTCSIMSLDAQPPSNLAGRTIHVRAVHSFVISLQNQPTAY